MSLLTELEMSTEVGAKPKNPKDKDLACVHCRKWHTKCNYRFTTVPAKLQFLIREIQIQAWIGKRNVKKYITELPNIA
jgi:hypothetical protein